MIHEKPWGYFQILLDENYSKVKKILIKKGHSPSYQFHYKRSEVWVILQGEAEVKINDLDKKYSKGDIIHIPIKTKHRVSNVGGEDLIFIEIQLGTYFGEDDIVRLEDKYGRI